MSRQNFRLRGGAVAFAMLGSISTPAWAADVAEPEALVGPPESVGIVCTLDDPFALAASAATLPWPSVWLGHFSGGRPYIDEYGRTLIDWRDEKVCFASRALCLDWIDARRRTYSDPEGDWTCLFLR